MVIIVLGCEHLMYYSVMNMLRETFSKSFAPDSDSLSSMEGMPMQEIHSPIAAGSTAASSNGTSKIEEGKGQKYWDNKDKKMKGAVGSI